MNKNIIYTFVFTLLFSLIGCSTLTSDTFKKSNAVYVTQNQLDEWKQNKKHIYYRNHEEVKESYLLENILLKNIQLLNNSEINKITFNSKLKMYQDSAQLHKKRIIQKLNVNENDQRQKFIELKNKKRKPKLIRLYQIFKKFPVQATEHEKLSIRVEMQNIRAQITDLDSFKLLAKQESDSQSSLRDGLIGNVYKGLLAEDLEPIVFNLEQGELSEIIMSQNGLMLFYCEKIIPAVVKTDKELMKMAMSQLKNKAFELEWSYFLENMQTYYHFNIDTFNNDTNFQNLNLEIGDEYITEITILNLLNNLNGNKSISKFSNKQITNSINNYILHKAMYMTLDLESQKSLMHKQHFNLNEMLSNQILLKLVNNKFRKPKQIEIENYFHENKNKYVYPALFDISGLAIKFEASNRLDAYKKIENIHNLIKSGAISFKEAAQQYSDFKELYNDGHLGVLSRQQIPSVLGINLLKEILKTPVNEISEIIQTDLNYFWIIKLNTKQKERIKTLEEAQKYIIRDLSNIQLNELHHSVVDDLLESNYLVIIK
jgi:parvulin-like peptidyl-prolyl isomerase